MSALAHELRPAQAGVQDSAASQVELALNSLDGWIEEQQFQGWGVYDALNSPLLRRLTFGNRLLGIGWVQLFKRSPVNLRPLLGVRKGLNPKGMGLFLATYQRKYWQSGDPAQLERVRYFAEWLQENRSPGYSGACWGYNFDWPNRGFFAPAGTPTIVNTSFIALAFLDAGTRRKDEAKQSRGQVQTAIPEWLSIARSACDFISKDLNRLTHGGTICFSYTPNDQRYVHNANLLGAQVLAHVYSHTAESELADLALASARYTARCQQPDGSWRYGEGGSDGWVDNFHTGFVLTALKEIATYLKTDEFDQAIADGYYRFWVSQMFQPDGAPNYYPHKAHPLDSHSVAQAILTYLAFADQDPNAWQRAWKTARWGIDNMQDRQGYFHYQIHRRYRIRIPYMRWSQAWMQRALTELIWTQKTR